MRYILIFFLLIAIIAIASTIYTVNNLTGFAVASETESNEKEPPSFKMYTKAVCKNKSNTIVCHDELFAQCEGVEYKLPKNEVNGMGIFTKDWTDPRYS